MIALRERFRLLVRCPNCARPIHLAPSAMQYATGSGRGAEFAREPLEAAVTLHMRLGCDRT